MLTGAASASTVTGVSGDYSFVGLSPGGSYTVTPSGLGYSFSPASQSFANLNGNQTAGFSGACLLSVSPSTVYLDSTAQSGPPIGVAASASCVWAATAGAAFLTLTSGASGSGDGTVAFSVPANTSGADLAGSLSVGGQTVSITQRETAAVFTDVGPVDFDFDAADILFAQGITGGCSATPRMYCPNENITRGQMAVFIVTAIEGGNSFTYTTTPYFTDVPSSNPFFKFIQKLKDLGITSGCTATTYCPGDPVTRGQMAVFIITARYGAIPYSYPSTPYFTDVPAANAFFAFIQKMAQVGITAGCAPGLYCPANTLTRGQMAIFISAGLLNELLPATTPLVVQATPHAAAPGQTVTVALSGCGTHFAPGSTQVATAPDITASNIAVTGPTSLTVQFTVSSGLTPGPSSIVATTGTEEAVLPNGFAVQ